MTNSSHINIPHFSQTVSPVFHEWCLIQNMASVNSFTIILQALNENDEPVNFPPNHKYDMYVSNTLKEGFVVWDFYDYFHQILINDPYEFEG